MWKNINFHSRYCSECGKIDLEAHTMLLGSYDPNTGMCICAHCGGNMYSPYI